jgi:hypothetical protein
VTASATEICNRALTLLGQRPIAALDDGTEPANALGRLYPQTLDYVLRLYPWNSATFMARLAANVVEPMWGYSFAYPLPSDPFCLRVLRLRAEAEQDLHWRLQGREIVSDIGAPLDIVFIGRPSNVGVLDPLLVDAIAHKLAADAAYVITQSDSAVSRMVQLYERALRDAKRVDAREQSQDDRVVDDGPWLSARLGARGYRRGIP